MRVLVIRYLPRDYNLFARLNPGDQYPEAYHHAETMFEEALAERHRKQPRYRRRVIIAERWLKEDTRIKFPDRPGRENRVCFS